MADDIKFESQIGPCSEFTFQGKRTEITVVISPLKLTQADGVMKLVSGCNFWKSCENRHCQFSLVARPPEKAGKK
jgi:hypothetical protein